METKSVLIVEDEYITAADIGNTLTDLGYRVTGTADNAGAAVRMAGDLKPDITLMDITLKGERTGIEAAAEIRERFGLPVVYMTGYSDEATVAKAMKADPFGYLVKPVDARILDITLRMALFKHALEERLRQSEHTTRALLNAVPDALMLVDSRLSVVAVNEAMARKLGAPPNAIAGRPVTDLAFSGTLGIPADELADRVCRMTPLKVAERQGERWFETSFWPVVSPAGTTGLFAIQSRDITDIRRLEEQLKAEGLTQIEHNMEQFQILNDQIRNPLQAIRGYLSLAECEYGDQINEQVRCIDEIVGRLDTGWLESEKVRSFLYRHYRHGDHAAAGQAGEAVCR